MSRCLLSPYVSYSAASLIAVAGMAVILTPGSAVSATSGTDPYAHLPASMRLVGIVRDFRSYNVSGGHPDFEHYNTGHRVQLVQEQLDADGKPVFKGQGKKVVTQYRDSQGRNINPSMYSAARGDVAGSLQAASDISVTSAASLAQWFRDVPGVNLSKSVSIELTRQPNSNIYSLRAEDDSNTPEREGFFLADNDLFNDMDPTYHHNYGYTFELGTTFTYRRSAGQVFKFIGDDDVYVFINGQLAIDVGGIHGAVEQVVDLDRLADMIGLQDGQKYPLKFFFAERHTTRSNCRIDTNLELTPADLPAVSALCD